MHSVQVRLQGRRKLAHSQPQSTRCQHPDCAESTSQTKNSPEYIKSVPIVYFLRIATASVRHYRPSRESRSLSKKDQALSCPVADRKILRCLRLLPDRGKTALLHG